LRRQLLWAAILAAVIAMVMARAVAAPVDTRGWRVSHFTIDSRLVLRRLTETLLTPPDGGASRPLLVFLHGRSASQDSTLSDQLFAALRALGARAPDVVFPYGGDHSYWHDRAGRAWGSYVLRELIPAAISRLHADGRRVAIGGESMGGFGAYDLARLAPGRFCAVGGHSAALWTASGQTAPGAFDDAADFARHDVIAAARHRPGLYRSARLWLDGGSADPFHAADEAFAAALGIHMHVWPGDHSGNYWNSHMRDYLGFYAAALAAGHAAG
jgi:S-formylglutathione hydrolase FrmB